MASASLEISLLFVTASSPEELARSCFLRQLSTGEQIQWHSVTYANGKWFAWYSGRVNSMAMVEPVPKKKVRKT